MNCPKCGSPDDREDSLDIFCCKKCGCTELDKTKWQQSKIKSLHQLIKEAKEIISQVDTVFWPTKERDKVEKWLNKVAK